MHSRKQQHAGKHYTAYALKWMDLEAAHLYVIVGKLSAYRRKNRAKRALWEFDNIIRSLYLLDYIDFPR